MKKYLFSFVGKPNSGKDTLMNDLTDYYSDYKPEVLSASKLIRGIDKNSSLWKEIEPLFNSGLFIPHEITNELLINAIKKSSGDIVLLNGSTNSMEQAKIFDSRGILPLDAFIHLDAPDEICKQRAKNRLVCSDCRTPYQIGQIIDKRKNLIAGINTDCIKCSGTLIQRTDDSNIQNRLNEFQTFTTPVLRHFEKDETPLHKIRITENTARPAVQNSAVRFLDKTFGL